MEYTQRQALGRAASLGALYDVHRDCFRPGSVFSGTLPPSCITCQDTPSSKIDIVSDETYSTTFKNHNIEGELKLSVLSGLVGLQGSGKYFENVKQSSRSVKLTLAYCICTKYEKINIYDTLLRQCVSTDALKTTDATHFVSEIQWGANAFASLEYRNTENDSKSNIEGELSGSLKAIKINIDVKGKGQVEQQENDTATRSTLKIIGDVIPRNQKVPQTLVEARDWLTELPENIQSYNEGKGVPLMFTLCPLGEVAQLVNVQLKLDKIVSRLDASRMQQWEHKFDNMLAAKQEFNDLWEDLHSPAAVCVPDADKEKIRQLKICVEDQESRLRDTIKKSLISLRSGNEQPDELIADSENKVRAFLAGKEKLLKKLSWVKQLQRQGIRFVMGCGRAKDFLESISLEYDEKSVYVLVCCTDSRSAESWEKNTRLFYKLNREHEDSKSGKTNCLLCVVEMEERDQLETKENVPSYLSIQDGLSRILHFENGRLVCNDVLADRNRVARLSLVKSSQHAEILVHPPNNRKALTIRCPGSFHGTCPADLREWSCERCLKHMEFGWDGYFYCQCGRFPVSECLFKCCSGVHGPSFEGFGTTDTLHKLLEELRRKINILILGPTGVGKSTWINAFANYIMYPSIEAAQSAKELMSVIPTSFTVTDTDFVAPGESGNEEHRPGQSATQSCRSYAFYIGDSYIVRLIDTPGIGDTRGAVVDDKNTEALLTFLGRYYKEIHGICVMLNAGESRLTDAFKSCIRSLLCHLHTSASENIVFLFSHAMQGGRFGPGQAIGPLKALLTQISEQPPYVCIECNERTRYCVENDTFQYLVAARDGRIEYTKEDREDYSKIWDRTVRECDRLIKHVMSLHPYRMEKSLHLHDARLSILELSEPLFELAVTIQRNVREVETKKGEVERLEGDMSELGKYVEREVCRLEVGKSGCIVCYRSACRDKYPVCESDVSWFVWHVFAPVADAEVGDVSFGGRREVIECRRCGCAWFQGHKRVNIETKLVKETVRDEKIDAKLRSVIDEKSKKKFVLAELEQTQRDWQEDERTVTRIVAKLAQFVRQNAITSYDPIDFANYVKKKREAASETEISALDSLLQAYQKEAEDVEKSKSNVNVAAAELPTILEELKTLKKVDGSKFKSDVEKASGHGLLDLPERQENAIYVPHASLPVFQSSAITGTSSSRT